MRSKKRGLKGSRRKLIGTVSGRANIIFSRLLQCQFLLRARVRAAFFADADFSAKGRRADALPPIFPPFLYGAELTRLPYPEPPGFSPPPCALFTVDQARRAAVLALMPRRSYPSSICSAWRFCFSVYCDLSPRGMISILLVPVTFSIVTTLDGVRRANRRTAQPLLYRIPIDVAEKGLDILCTLGRFVIEQESVSVSTITASSVIVFLRGGSMFGH